MVRKATCQFTEGGLNSAQKEKTLATPPWISLCGGTKVSRGGLGIGKKAGGAGGGGGKEMSLEDEQLGVRR